MSLSLVRWVNVCTAASPAYENSVMFGSFHPYLTLPPQRFISPYCLDSIIVNILLFIKEGVAKHFKWGGGMSSKCLIYKAKTINFLMQDCLSYSLMFPDATRVETLHCTFVNRLNQIYASMVNLHHCFLSQALCAYVYFRDLTHQSILRCFGDIVTCTRCCDYEEDEHQ